MPRTSALPPIDAQRDSALHLLVEELRQDALQLAEQLAIEHGRRLQRWARAPQPATVAQGAARRQADGESEPCCLAPPHTVAILPEAAPAPAPRPLSDAKPRSQQPQPLAAHLGLAKGMPRLMSSPTMLSPDADSKRGSDASRIEDRHSERAWDDFSNRGSGNSGGEMIWTSPLSARTITASHRFESAMESVRARYCGVVPPASSRSDSVREWFQQRGGVEDNAGGKFVENLPTQSVAYRVVNSSYFDPAMCTMILLSSIISGVKVDSLARERKTDADAPLMFELAGFLFVVIFSLELVLRFLAGPASFCSRSEWKWSALDTFTVVVMILDEAIAATDLNLGALRILRTLRLVRFLRLFRLMDSLRSMVSLLSVVSSSFFWAVLLVIFLLYSVALLMTEMASQVALQATDDAVAQALRFYWGSIPASMITLFSASFGGFDWRDSLEVFKLVEDQGYALAASVLLLYISFNALVLLNLVSGIFMQGASLFLKEERDKSLFRLARLLFKTASERGTEQLFSHDLISILTSEEIKAYCDDCDVGLKDVEELFMWLNRDGNGIGITDFLRGCKMMAADVRGADMRLLRLMSEHMLVSTTSKLERIENRLLRDS